MVALSLRVVIHDFGGLAIFTYEASHVAYLCASKIRSIARNQYIIEVLCLQFAFAPPRAEKWDLGARSPGLGLRGGSPPGGERPQLRTPPGERPQLRTPPTRPRH